MIKKIMVASMLFVGTTHRLVANDIDFLKDPEERKSVPSRATLASFVQEDRIPQRKSLPVVIKFPLALLFLALEHPLFLCGTAALFWPEGSEGCLRSSKPLTEEERQEIRDAMDRLGASG